MKHSLRSLAAFAFWQIGFVAAFALFNARAQSCQTSAELQDAVRINISATGQRYFDMAVKGDVVSLKQNSIPSLAADFSAVESRIKDHQQDLAGAQATLKTPNMFPASSVSGETIS